jgi:uncharacterized cupin superfamily protein
MPAAGVPEAPLRTTAAGLVPGAPGWFIVNVAQAAGWRSPRFGESVHFEGAGRFPQFGVNVRRLAPGQPSGLYHREGAQEAYLVLRGSAIAIIEGQERLVGAGDFVHLPAGTAHTIVAAGDEPCIVVMVGARAGEPSGEYPDSAAAANHGAASRVRTSDPAVAYEQVEPAVPAAVEIRWA